MNKYDIYNKAIKVIDSCENVKHFIISSKYCKFAAKAVDDDELYRLIRRKLFDRIEEVYNFYQANYLCGKLLNNK